jgi:galactokinase
VNSLWQSYSYTRSIRTREELAAYLAAVENGQPFAAFSGGAGVGTLGGSEDHVAILCSRAGFLSQYSYCPIRLEREIPFPQNYTIVIGVSGVKADKTGSARDAYNRASLAARKLLDLWNRATERNDPSLAAALSSEPNALARFQHILRGQAGLASTVQALLNRHSQFTEESNEIVPAVGDALRALDMERLGALVDRSEFLAETLLANQTPETIDLARSARELGAAAASAFGAGFGGSVWALVPSARAHEFSDSWAHRYRTQHPDRANASEFLLTRPGPALLDF